MLPLAGRIRFMMFASLLSLLVTCLLLFLDISHVIYLFPFNWGKIVSCNHTKTKQSSKCDLFSECLFIPQP